MPKTKKPKPPTRASASVLEELLRSVPTRRVQMYFKSALVALSHAMEDQVLAGVTSPLIIATFQQERFYRQESNRYQKIALQSSQVYILAAPETDFKNASGAYETIAFKPTDALALEWHLVIISPNYNSCLICREKPGSTALDLAMDANRRFEGIWTSERPICEKAATILLDRILFYRPELATKVQEAYQTYFQSTNSNQIVTLANPEPFVNRLVTYLQVSQYKLLKTYRSMRAREERERMLNLITVAIRRSLEPEEVLAIAVEQLSQALGTCRNLIYRCKEDDLTAIISHEALKPGMCSLKGKTWLLKDNPGIQLTIATREPTLISDALNDPRLQKEEMQKLVQESAIVSWLLVPIFYQDRLLGIVELHHCGPLKTEWNTEEMGLVEAIASQVGVALIQAEAYANLQDLNEQLEALDRTRSNLVAITGHELRTPLSTIQVCLESLASEPDMAPELREIMIETALADADRMRKLVQDFLTLSQLESGRVEWHPEALGMRECVDLGLSHIRSRYLQKQTPTIQVSLPPSLPLVRADGEWLVEVFAKLLDNACKFTPTNGHIFIEAQEKNQIVQVTISDTGRGIEPNRLETVFDRFYQEEGALQRTQGGTGLGLAICRQIVQRWGGTIWAESAGKNSGTKFHFTIPIFEKN